MSFLLNPLFAVFKNSVYHTSRVGDVFFPKRITDLAAPKFLPDSFWHRTIRIVTVALAQSASRYLDQVIADRSHPGFLYSKMTA